MTAANRLPPEYKAAVEDVTADAVVEILRQYVRWGLPTHAPERWLAILTEEVGEVARAALLGDDKAMAEEAIQVAAVAINIAIALRKR